MSRSWWLRLYLLVFFVIVAFVHVFPTVASLDLEKTNFPYKKKVNLGLDLQGGLYMVYGVDFKKVYKETLERTLDGFKAELEKAGLNAAIGQTDSTVEEDPKSKVTFDATMKSKVSEVLEKSKGSLRIIEEGTGSLDLALARDYRGLIKDNTLNQSVQVIRNRIDEFGVSEPSITTKGNDKVVVELPGVKDVERAVALVGRTARLEFRIVNDKAMSAADLHNLIESVKKEKGLNYKEGSKFSEYQDAINAGLKGKIPEDSQVLFERKGGEMMIPYLLFTKVELSGSELQDAFVSLDSMTQSPVVSFHLNPRGAATFGEVTGANIGHRLAIVLDNIVFSAPNIQSKIPNGSGQITLGGGRSQDVYKEAKDLSIVLRAGALPAQLELMEQRIIGPSIGQDSIKHGLMASLVGCSLVFIFMLFYYRLSGLVATVSLILNGLFTFAILIAMDATLTLPGIAGLALTIGMAVDSNVIIFERIRDELMEGRSVAAAVQAGFDKAFSCIFDANITHAIVAIILLNFGSGPIRGFAVTLIVGIVTTLFCAVTVCKLMFDLYLAKRTEATELSI